MILLYCFIIAFYLSYLWNFRIINPRFMNWKCCFYASLAVQYFYFFGRFTVNLKEKKLLLATILSIEKENTGTERQSKIIIIYRRSSLLHFFLTHFMPLVSFDTPWKHQKTSGFPMFSGGIESVFRGYRKRPVPWNGLNMKL